jgi:transcriptional regulator with XRE-family HTH domain
MREKPLHLASKLKTIRQRLGLSQTEMVKRLKSKANMAGSRNMNLENVNLAH